MENEARAKSTGDKAEKRGWQKLRVNNCWELYNYRKTGQIPRKPRLREESSRSSQLAAGARKELSRKIAFSGRGWHIVVVEFKQSW